MDLLKKFFCIVIFLWTPSVWAADMDAIIDQALARNASLVSSQKDAQAMKARIPQASALPDPMVTYVFMGEMLETPLGEQKDVVEVEQDIPYPGKLIRRRRAAQSDARVAGLQHDVLRRDIIFQVKSAVYDLWAAQRNFKRLMDKQDLLKVVESSVQAGYASGRNVQKDVLAAQSEQALLQQESIGLQRQQERAQAALQNLLNTQEVVEVDMPESWAIDPAVSLESLLEKLNDNPEIAQAQAAFQAEESRKVLARQANRPDFKIGFQYYNIREDAMSAGMDDAGRDAWMIPLTVTLPVWQNRIRSEIHEAQDRLEASRARMDAVRRQKTFDLKDAYLSYQSGCKTFALYRDELIPQAQSVASSDRSGYESGKVRLEEWAGSRKTVLDLETAMDNVLVEVMKDRASIEKIVGDF